MLSSAFGHHAGQLSPASSSPAASLSVPRCRRYRRRRHPAGPGRRSSGAVVLALVTEDIPVHVRLDLAPDTNNARRDDLFQPVAGAPSPRGAHLTAQAVHRRVRPQRVTGDGQDVKAGSRRRAAIQPLGDVRPLPPGVHRARPAPVRISDRLGRTDPQPIPPPKSALALLTRAIEPPPLSSGRSSHGPQRRSPAASPARRGRGHANGAVRGRARSLPIDRARRGREPAPTPRAPREHQHPDHRRKHKRTRPTPFRSPFTAHTQPTATTASSPPRGHCSPPRHPARPPAGPYGRISVARCGAETVRDRAAPSRQTEQRRGTTLAAPSRRKRQRAGDRG